jgi:hypothetical protein
MHGAAVRIAGSGGLSLDFAVSSLYETPGKFSGGVIQFVGVTVEGTPYIDLEGEAKRVMMGQ